MAVSYMINVAALHDEDFFQHLFARNVVTCSWTCFVAVHTFHLDSLAVKVVVTSCQSELVVFSGSLLYFYLAESHGGRECFYHSAFLVFQLAYKRIAVRSLSTPRLNFIACLKSNGSCLFAFFLQIAYGSCSANARHQSILVRVELVGIECIVDGISLSRFVGKVTNVGRYAERSVCVRSVVIGDSLEVAYLNLWFSGKRYAAEYTRQTEHILTFEERAVAVAVNLYSYYVFAFLIKIRCDVELSQVSRVLREAYITSVYVEVEE